MAAFGIVPSHSKYLATDFTVPILADPFYIIVPWPKEQSRLLAMIRPFQYPVSILLLLFRLRNNKRIIR